MRLSPCARSRYGQLFLWRGAPPYNWVEKAITICFALLSSTFYAEVLLMAHWLAQLRANFYAWVGNVFSVVLTVIRALWVTVRYWLRTYDPRRRTFTEHFEYPEQPVLVAPRYRGFHRFDLTTCIACERCAGLPRQLHLHRQGKGRGQEGISCYRLCPRLY